MLLEIAQTLGYTVYLFTGKRKANQCNKQRCERLYKKSIIHFYCQTKKK